MHLFEDNNKSVQNADSSDIGGGSVCIATPSEGTSSISSGKCSLTRSLSSSSSRHSSSDSGENSAASSSFARQPAESYNHHGASGAPRRRGHAPKEFYNSHLPHAQATAGRQPQQANGRANGGHYAGYAYYVRSTTANGAAAGGADAGEVRRPQSSKSVPVKSVSLSPSPPASPTPTGEGAGVLAEVPTISGVCWTRSHEYPRTFEGLQNEILECYAWLRPTRNERRLRWLIAYRIRQILTPFWPEASYAIFGSFATELFLPTSDIDITVNSPTLNVSFMVCAAEALRMSGTFSEVHVLDKACVPIIKLVDSATGLRVDVSFNLERAQEAARYVDYMRCRYPALAPAILILKQFLDDRKLNHVFTGGLSSYTLVTMVMHFMLRKYADEFVNRPIVALRPGVLGEFLVDFLRFYSVEFNAQKHGLAFERPEKAVVMDKDQLTQRLHEMKCMSLFCIQDPLHTNTDVGRGVHNFISVRAAFHDALIQINNLLAGQRDMEDQEARVLSPLLSKLIHFSPEYVEARQRLDAYTEGHDAVTDQQADYQWFYFTAVNYPHRLQLPSIGSGPAIGGGLPDGTGDSGVTTTAPAPATMLTAVCYVPHLNLWLAVPPAGSQQTSTSNLEASSTESSVSSNSSVTSGPPMSPLGPGTFPGQLANCGGQVCYIPTSTVPGQQPFFTTYPPPSAPTAAYHQTSTAPTTDAYLQRTWFPSTMTSGYLTDADIDRSVSNGSADRRSGGATSNTASTLTALSPSIEDIDIRSLSDPSPVLSE